MGPMAVAASLGHRGRLGNISENVPERKALEKVNRNMNGLKKVVLHARIESTCDLLSYFCNLVHLVLSF